MAGMQAKTLSDVARNRQQYMADLNLRCQLDDKVLQAVKLNKRTGQVPQPPTDMRTLEEKMADVERLKLDIRKAL